MNQAYKTACLFAADDKDMQLKILKESAELIKDVTADYTAPFFASKIQEIAEKHTGSSDLYAQIKERNIKVVSKFIPYIRAMMDGGYDNFEIALRAAIMGNTIDMGANPGFDIFNEINTFFSDKIVLNQYHDFKEQVSEASTVLYIGDNYEESLFDQLLIEQIGGERVVFAVRSKPVLNDIIMKDALSTGMNKICRVIDSGSTIAGTNMSEVTDEFRELFEKADAVISKGQGNFETLLNSERKIWFLFKVKCEAIAQRSGFNVGKSVLLSYRGKPFSEGV